MMSTKRWVAVGIALGVLFLSIISQVVTSLIFSAMNEEATSIVDFFMTDDRFHQEIIEEGDFSSRIAVLEVNGPIIDTDNSGLFSGGSGYNHQDFLDKLEIIAEDSTIHGVILSINSPGGGSFESAQIARRLDALQEDFDLPIYASFGAMATSGGYFIAAGADRIFVTPQTWTGSIGVVVSTLNFSGLMERHGVSQNITTSGDFKDIFSMYRPSTEADKQIMQTLVDDTFDDFVDVIVRGRGLSEARVREIGDGRIINGSQAVEMDLADDFGELADVIVAMRESQSLHHAEVFRFESTQGGVGSIFLSRVGQVFGQNDLISSRLFGQGNTPRAMLIYGGQ